MLWNDILNFLAEKWITILSVLIFCLLAFVAIRYIKILMLFGQCRKLAKLYNGNLEKKRPLFLRIFFNFKEADIKISFADKELYVMFIRIKRKTTIRFMDANTIERIRYRKAIVPSSNSKGLSPGSGYAIVYGQGSEVTSKSSITTFNFNYNRDALGLILFTENPSEMLVFDSSRNNYNIIGDGEMAFFRYVGGRSFIKKWIERNN